MNENECSDSQTGDCLVQNVCCRHRPGFGAEDDFPDHDTKTAFELPIRRASAKRCGLRLVVARLRAGAQFGWGRHYKPTAQ